MTYAQPMAELATQRSPVERGAVVECIRACVDCAQACTACADACLGEPHVQQLTRCIRLDLDCADLCAATAAIISRQTAAEPGLMRSVLQACALACGLCGDECERHSQQMEHCRVCAEACRRCEQACNAILPALSA